MRIRTTKVLEHEGKCFPLQRIGSGWTCLVYQVHGRRQDSRLLLVREREYNRRRISTKAPLVERSYIWPGPDAENAAEILEVNKHFPKIRRVEGSYDMYWMLRYEVFSANPTKKQKATAAYAHMQLVLSTMNEASEVYNNYDGANASASYFRFRDVLLDVLRDKEEQYPRSLWLAFMQLIDAVNSYNSSLDLHVKNFAISPKGDLIFLDPFGPF